MITTQGILITTAAVITVNFACAACLNWWRRDRGYYSLIEWKTVQVKSYWQGLLGAVLAIVSWVACYGWV